MKTDGTPNIADSTCRDECRAPRPTKKVYDDEGNDVTYNNEAVTKYWLDYYVSSEHHLCILCGNKGVIDTTGTTNPRGTLLVGRRVWCICPNGQAYRHKCNGQYPE